MARKRNVDVSSRASGRGFTLTELVVVIMVLGALAVVALPRFADQTDFTVQGTVDQAASALRYAQKAAIAARSDVLVTFGANGFTACFASGGSCTANVVDPTRGTQLGVSGDASVTVGGASFSFDALGRPSTGATAVTVSGGGMTRTVTVEAETGYVRQ